MNHLLNSRAVYRAAGRDYRELIFFSFMILAIFLKFYFLEYEVSRAVTRVPFSVAASLAIAAALVLPASLFWHRGRLALSLLLDFMLTALVITDILHMRYYSDLFTFHNLGLSAQVGEVSESVFALFSAKDLLYFFDIPVLFGYFRIFRHISVHPFFHRITRRRFFRTCLLFAAAVAVVAFHISGYNKKVPGVLRSMWDRPAVCNNVGALTYHLADSWNTLTDRAARPKLSASELEGVREWFEGHLSRQRRPQGVFGIARGKNLIVIQVESLQSFAVGLKVGGREVTPNLNAFVREASLASNVYNQTGSGNSSDAEFLANAALYPAASGVAYTRFAGNHYAALPGVLRENGYRAVAMHGDRAGFWNRGHMYPALGFERFISKKDYVNDESIGMGLSDRSFFRQSLAMLSRERQPFYAFMITLTSHYPYSFPKLLEQAAFDAGEYKGTVVGSYLAAIHYLDREFGAFIKGLKKSGLYDKSVIALYGDHNAIPRWDSPTLSKLLGIDFTKDHNWRYVQRVPLVINVPGVKKLGWNHKMALGLVNLPRSLALLLGIDFESGLGTDIFDGSDAPVIFRNGSYVTGEIFVEPAKKSAVNVRSGEPRDYSVYAEMTERVKKTLDISDKILEYDLMPQIYNK
ncbi:LTA synthase family protein [Cloacibacillus evryensis]|uniref:LTA synthase family protein n=1 Tax=Cloacibacillus evryensis TaxID=508460 RepID=UPI0004529DFA|nr:LTA synthase family protein [Cloacibacillus evryensis]EXG78660.1 phosphoglycerol transferase family protein, alkaline phosphatase superfamily [Cloacibacillus evryensis DSM 19522]MEA5034510.1 LTA synthase family protein [Cloacibacillus evryensis]